MSWTPVTSSSAAWTAVSSSVVTWSGVTVVHNPPPWGLLSSLTSTADEGIDFRLTMHDESPWYISSDRPMVMREIQPEGQP